MIQTLTQRHHLPMMASAANLRCIGRIYSHVQPTSFFRFAGELTEKGRPRRIMDALGQTMIMRHLIHAQVLNTDDTVGIDDLAACLMCEIFPPPGYPLRKSWFLSVFSHSTKVSLESKVNPNGYVLQDLGMDFSERGTFLFQDRKRRLLSIECQALACQLIGFLALFKQVVIQPTALLKRLIELLFLLRCGVEAILKRFTHVCYM